MDYIKKIPFITSVATGIAVGIISLMSGVDKSTVYIRMIISLIIFYIVGLFLKSIIEKTIDEVKEKELLERLKKEEEERKKAEEEEAKKKEKLKKKKEAIKNGVELELSSEPVFDDDEGEEFEPLTVNEVIESNDDEENPI
jgi:uncharacterized membrane protein (DUF106 family)